jgi:hypothetical protein
MNAMTFDLGRGRSLPLPSKPCATRGCTNLVTEPWDESGNLCARCAIEDDLADRYGRWDRLFPIEVEEPAA